MAIIRCLLIDDEPPAIELLKKHISTLPDVEIVGTCYSAIEASSILATQKVDLIFLDIQMPVLTGLEFLKTKKELPKVILTTAYREYAVESYEYDVVDYLLKPISFTRFFKAIEKYYQKSDSIAHTPHPIEHNNTAYIHVNINKKIHKVLLANILYVESLKDYVKIHTQEKTLVVKSNIGSIEQQLPTSQFVRIHRSYIVAIDKITAYTNLDIEIGAIEIPIGQTYKEKVKALYVS
jgi:DNA-binding LytR/AlgR family response regulator